MLEAFPSDGDGYFVLFDQFVNLVSKGLRVHKSFILHLVVIQAASRKACILHTIVQHYTRCKFIGKRGDTGLIDLLTSSLLWEKILR